MFLFTSHKQPVLISTMVQFTWHTLWSQMCGILGQECGASWGRLTLTYKVLLTHCSQLTQSGLKPIRHSFHFGTKLSKIVSSVALCKTVVSPGLYHCGYYSFSIKKKTPIYRWFSAKKDITPVLTHWSYVFLVPTLFSMRHAYIYGLVQERRNSIANTLELRLFCTKPLI